MSGEDSQRPQGVEGLPGSEQADPVHYPEGMSTRSQNNLIALVIVVIIIYAFYAIITTGMENVEKANQNTVEVPSNAPVQSWGEVERRAPPRDGVVRDSSGMPIQNQPQPQPQPGLNDGSPRDIYVPPSRD